ncbi:hypothetical protein LMG29542_07537 [Paraburkholderia humisilvae]|uniref:Uncharacterized protein n=1 Tax=Paraburkholderia humisilvae TaxID=627669 RepID=A0A6J5F905_9BURK|nr:hypothetical protein LMG29542_07537 [Paraburkholderia humisilvae]
MTLGLILREHQRGRRPRARVTIPVTDQKMQQGYFVGLVQLYHTLHPLPWHQEGARLAKFKQIYQVHLAFYRIENTDLYPVWIAVRNKVLNMRIGDLVFVVRTPAGKHHMKSDVEVILIEKIGNLLMAR